MTENIFLSYRRDDSRGYTNAIYTLLELHFPPGSIFMDVDTLVPGSDFVQSLQEAVENCDIFLAVIGSRWENIKNEKGQRRLENPEDFVRIEVAHALERGIPVIPVLVDGAQMPSSDNLPDNLKDLARRHAFTIGDHMRPDMERLIKVLEKTFERLEKERLEKEKKEAELLAMAQAEEERKAQEKAEVDRIAKEKAEADRIAKEKAEADRIAKEKAEADRIAKEKAEADRIAKEKAEADRKAKKEAKQKARTLAVAEKKEADDKKRLSRQKTGSTAGQQAGKAVSPSAVKKIPVWAWPVAGVVLIAIGYGIFRGFRPSLSEEPRETEVSQTVAYTNTPISEAISSTPTPQATVTSTAVPTPTPTTEPPAGAETTNWKNGAVMVYVPSGEFIMGSDSGAANESPAHTVYLDGFWIGKTEVTNEMYRLCFEADACVKYEWQDGFFDAEFEKDHPVTNITWKQAGAYCRWAGGYLPTEAQWEKAARGTDGRTYPWGEGVDHSLANYGGYIGSTLPVGSYPAGVSPYGLLDMAGNVGEYVADWYNSVYYSLSPEGDPSGPEDGLERVVRGGSWNSSGENIRVTRRSSELPLDSQSDRLGFRCAFSQLP